MSTEQWTRHSKTVEVLRTRFNGTAFTKAPFDIMDENNNFYQVKCPNDRKGKHKGECRISVSRDELNFGMLLKGSFIFIVVYDNCEYVIPFSDLEKRILANKPSQTKLGGMRRQVTLGRKFLSQYLRT
jgi:hypothetical protein